MAPITSTSTPIASQIHSDPHQPPMKPAAMPPINRIRRETYIRPRLVADMSSRAATRAGSRSLRIRMAAKADAP